MGEEATTASDLTANSALRKATGRQSQSPDHRSAVDFSPTRLPDGEGMSREGSQLRLNKKNLAKLDTKEMNALMNQEDEDEDRRAEIAEQQRRQRENPLKEFYKDKKGQYFDPKKKFGVLESSSKVYDNITTAYPLNLPSNYYLNMIKDQIPKKEDGKWFIRPHHVESLTEHT